MRYVLFLSLLLFLVGCTSNKEELVSQMVSKEEEHQIYIMYEDNKQMKTHNIHEQVLSIVGKYMEKVSNVHEVYDVKEIKEVLNIKEYPTILIFDKKGLVLQTNNLNELEAFLSK